MLTNEEFLVKLTGVWYTIVNLDHHKDRDCHWYIEKKYSYGHKAVWNVTHFGYIVSNFPNQEFKTFEEAEKYLIKTLVKLIKEEIESLCKNCDDNAEVDSIYDVLKINREFNSLLEERNQ